MGVWGQAHAPNSGTVATEKKMKLLREATTLFGGRSSDQFSNYSTPSSRAHGYKRCSSLNVDVPCGSTESGPWRSMAPPLLTAALPRSSSNPRK